MAFQVSSVDKCDEYTSDISGIMSGIVSDFVPKGCEKDGMESFLLADTQIPIVASIVAWENADALFGVLSFVRVDPLAVFGRILGSQVKLGSFAARIVRRGSEPQGVHFDTPTGASTRTARCRST